MPAIRHLLALDDLTERDLRQIITRAEIFAKAWATRNVPPILENTSVGLIISDEGWRNTSAFDLGIQAMGGRCAHVPLQLGTREEIPDVAGYLGNWFDAVISRAPDISVLRELADAARFPVINARTRQNHPCETLGDLAYFWHRHQKLDHIKVVVVAPDANILGSWIEASRRLPIDVVQVYPDQWHAPQKGEARFSTRTDMDEIRRADIVITDCWPKEATTDDLLPFQITEAVLDGLKTGAEFLPCPPVSRGKEVSHGAMQHEACRVTGAKAYLMHAQNAALEWCLGLEVIE